MEKRAKLCGEPEQSKKVPGEKAVLGECNNQLTCSRRFNNQLSSEGPPVAWGRVASAMVGRSDYYSFMGSLMQQAACCFLLAFILSCGSVALGR